jgi:hypothetical protein
VHHFIERNPIGLFQVSTKGIILLCPFLCKRRNGFPVYFYQFDVRLFLRPAFCRLPPQANIFLCTAMPVPDEYSGEHMPYTV